MEQGGGTSNLQSGNVTAVQESGSMIQEAPGAENNPSGSSTEQTTKNARAYNVMPTTNVLRIMRSGLPEHAKIANDAKDKMQECVSSFIQVVTNEANLRCHQEHRRTITGEDLIVALGKLGLDNYVESLTCYLNKYREHEFQKNSLSGERYKKRNISFVQPQITPQAPLQIEPLNYAWDMPTDDSPDGHGEGS
ncbi:unnamed protein product [Fraxinus pennsylvanica]|uniref:Transcription factor CBF/NF-Y/archaeal histone domain-containing protein n=1 Tax=Fraxinus pennsylvanica TaxID=56036 RepID=A0AAD2AGI5_9LAMI|nr:unnamed protein product [Fraxinus pennsylvanica]